MMLTIKLGGAICWRSATFISSGSLAVESFRDAVRNGCQFGKDIVASKFGIMRNDTDADADELYYETVEPLDALEYTNGRVLTLLVPKEAKETWVRMIIRTATKPPFSFSPMTWLLSAKMTKTSASAAAFHRTP